MKGNPGFAASQRSSATSGRERDLSQEGDRSGIDIGAARSNARTILASWVSLTDRINVVSLDDREDDVVRAKDTQRDAELPGERGIWPAPSFRICRV